MCRAVVILGPTAVGKSEVGLVLAELWGGEIVSADALQAYRGLDVGTAKPTVEERRRVRHHLLDFLEPEEPYSAGRFAELARRAIGEIAAQGVVPLVVGGSGLYLRALLGGLAAIPEVPAEVRRRLEGRLAGEGLAALRAELERVDPVAAARFSDGDPQRTLRALEVFEATGRPLSRWWEETGEPPLAADVIGLTLPRALLYDRIAGRVRRMLEGGWTEEVERLLRSGLSADCPAFQAIGYRELVRHARGEWSLEETVEVIVRRTRQYAKRQMTWFRRMPDVVWIREVDLDDRVASIRRVLPNRFAGAR
ncbi:MAG: tRNA (adenosine(37)-N6)-dimethylallyltransferase MiaA [Thermoanaerobaculia bacterium]